MLQRTTPAQKVLIRIGHPSYCGDNAMKYVRSKAAAVRELHLRGVKRDVARLHVNAVCSKLGGYAIVSSRPHDCGLIEIGNYSDEA